MDNFQALENLPPVELDVKATDRDTDCRRLLTVTVHNPSAHIALMAHLQLRRAHSGRRVLPAFYSENYLSLVPGETKTVTIEAERSGFGGESPLIAVDGWNATVANSSGEVAIALNTNAQVDQWPRTGLPIVPGPPGQYEPVAH